MTTGLDLLGALVLRRWRWPEGEEWGSWCAISGQQGVRFLSAQGSDSDEANQGQRGRMG